MPDAEPVVDPRRLSAHRVPARRARLRRSLDAITETAALSVVNWAETLSKLAADGGDPQQIADSLHTSDSPLILEPLTDADCVEIARLRPLTKHAGSHSPTAPASHSPTGSTYPSSPPIATGPTSTSASPSSSSARPSLARQPAPPPLKLNAQIEFLGPTRTPCRCNS